MMTVDSGGVAGTAEELDVWRAELEEVDRAIERCESFKTQTFVFGTGGIVLLMGATLQSAATGETTAQMLALLLVAVVSAFLGMFLVDRDEAILARVNYRETVIKPRVRELLGSDNVLGSWEFFNREVYGRNRPLIRKVAHRLTAPFPHALFYVAGLGSFGYLLHSRVTGQLPGGGWGWALALAGAALAYSWMAAFLTGAQWANVASPSDERGIPFLRRRSRARLPRVAEWSPGDAHVHTNWSDGWRSVWAQAETASRRDLDWVVVTDHADRVGENWDGYLRALDEVQSRLQCVLLLPGVEITVVDRPGGEARGDLLVYGWPARGDIPPANRVSAAQGVLARVAATAPAFAAVAHPYNGGAPFSTGFPGTNFGAVAWQEWEVGGLACLELLSYERRPSEGTLERWFDLLDRHLEGGPFVAAIAGTDSHLPWDAPASRGMTWTRLGSEIQPSSVTVLEALRHGRSIVSGMGDFGTLELHGAGPGDRLTEAATAATLVQRPAMGRQCTAVELLGPGREVLLHAEGPFEPSFTVPCAIEAGYVVARFSFSRGGRAEAEVWTNPVFVHPDGREG